MYTIEDPAPVDDNTAIWYPVTVLPSPLAYAVSHRPTGPVDCETKEVLEHVADEYIETKPHNVALGGTGTGVGTALGLSVITGA